MPDADIGSPDRKKQRMPAATIADELLRLIVNQTYHPGQRITEQEVADRFGVSRGPVREALRSLAARGVLKIEPQRGASVVRFTDEETRDAIEISAVIFGVAARRAAERATEEDIAALKAEVECLGELAAAETSARDYFLATLRAGHALLLCTKSERLSIELQQSRAGPPHMFGPLGFTTRALRKRSARNWKMLAEAVSAGDSRKAENLAITIYADASEAARSVAY